MIRVIWKIDRKKDDDMIDISYVENSVLSRRSKTKITAFLITVVLTVDSSNISCDSSFFYFIPYNSCTICDISAIIVISKIIPANSFTFSRSPSAFSVWVEG